MVTISEDLELELKRFLEKLLSFRSISGEETPAQEWIADRIKAKFDQHYVWTPEVDTLLSNIPHIESVEGLPDGVDEIPIVAGVLEFGDPEAGKTLVLNGHVDVVTAEEDSWQSDPFSPTWNGDDLRARGAVDMKSGLAAAYFAALSTRNFSGLNGRIVFECVPGEEIGGTGAIASAYADPYPFERDAVIISEATELELHAASGGSIWKQLRIKGRSAHSSTPWRGESVLPHFERIRRAIRELEADRATRIRHPYYNQYENPWPVNIGDVQTKPADPLKVPDTLTAVLRLGVAPQETIEEVEEEYWNCIDEVVSESQWLTQHPPTFERYGINHILPSEVPAEDSVVNALQEGMVAAGISDTSIRGFLGGADTRFYVDAGIPSVMFGPTPTDSQHGAHAVDESVNWPSVKTTAEVLLETSKAYLSSGTDLNQ